MSKERYDGMSWGTEKMTAMHKAECGRVKAIIMPYKTLENFPRIFAGDKNNPNKITYDKLGKQDINLFSRFTRKSFTEQVTRVGRAILAEDSRRGK